MKTRASNVINLNLNPYIHTVQVQKAMCCWLPDFATGLRPLLGLAIAKRPCRWGDSPNLHVSENENVKKYICTITLNTNTNMHDTHIGTTNNQKI